MLEKKGEKNYCAMVTLVIDGHVKHHFVDCDLNKSDLPVPMTEQEADKVVDDWYQKYWSFYKGMVDKEGSNVSEFSCLVTEINAAKAEAGMSIKTKNINA